MKTDVRPVYTLLIRHPDRHEIDVRLRTYLIRILLIVIFPSITDKLEKQTSLETLIAHLYVLLITDLGMETDIKWIEPHLTGCLLDKYSDGRSVTSEFETIILYKHSRLTS